MSVVCKILVIVATVRAVYGLSCTSCIKTACVEPLNCEAGLVKGLCGCCNVCAKVKNERCGGPWSIHGKCAQGLKCVTRTQLESRHRFLPEYFKTGVCEPDTCRNKTCGFRQKCKLNKRGESICVCPRRCGKTRYPVCGLLNGKQYRNKCRLQREECKTKTEIGLVMGECKKCTYNAKEFKFGETRPDAKPCETCVCHHGLWKCDIKPSCFLNNLPIRSDHPSCLMSQDGKKHVLPCPRGFSCRLFSSDSIHDSYRVGVCKQKKVEKPKKVLRIVEVYLERNSISGSEHEREDRLAERRMPAESEYQKVPVFTEMKTASNIRSVPTVQFKNDQLSNGGLMTHVCLADPDKRSCTSTTSIRWYYNATTRSCVQFNYGGCGGNFNNFLSMEKCQNVCQSSQISGSHPAAWLAITPTQSSPMYISTPNIDSQMSRVLLDMCHDMKSGMSYRNGEKWHVDACTSCSCVSGRALCIAATCPMTCWDAVHVEGKCCPVCKTDFDNEIIVEGEDTRCKDTETEVWYQSGESWHKDNCTSCVCIDGEISCIASVCSKPLCNNPVKKDGVCCPVCLEENEKVVEPTKKSTNAECKDPVTDKLYLPGEGWNVDDCVSCFCSKNGQQVCHETKCSVSKCENPVHLQGRCCPVCPEVFHSACIYDNHQYFQGDFMLLRDKCTLCKCNGNMWNCTKKHCNTTAKDEVVSPLTFTPTSANKMLKQGTTSNRAELRIHRKMAGDVLNDGSEKSEDYIVEDPARMTRRNTKKLTLQKDKVNKDSERDNIFDKYNINNEEIPWAESDEDQDWTMGLWH